MAEVARAEERLEVPAEVHGFAVEIGVGPYPMGHRRSHRRAVYATLRPLTMQLAARLERAGYRNGTIVGQAVVDDKTARQLQLPQEDPGRPTLEEQEALALLALAPAAELAKQVAEAND